MATDENRKFTEKFALRMPEGLRDELKALANQNNRSLNAEIVDRLRKSVDDEAKPKEGGLRFLAKAARANPSASLEERVAKLEDRLDALERKG